MSIDYNKVFRIAKNYNLDYNRFSAALRAYVKADVPTPESFKPILALRDKGMQSVIGEDSSVPEEEITEHYIKSAIVRKFNINFMDITQVEIYLYRELLKAKRKQ